MSVRGRLRRSLVLLDDVAGPGDIRNIGRTPQEVDLTFHWFGNGSRVTARPDLSSRERLLSAGNGTTARIAVPAPGRDWTERFPPTKWTLSSMLISPRPPARRTCSTSNPIPRSRTASRISFAVPRSSTVKFLVPLYFLALLRVSWVIRKRHKATSLGKCLGTLSSVNSTDRPWTSEYSLQKLLIATATPRYSRFDECSWCEREWSSSAMSAQCS